MADELELDLSQEEQAINKTQERITNLSSKVKDTAKERDEAKAAAEAAEQARIAAEKERDFFKDFSGLTSKYSAAGEYQSQILEKVKAGYSVEDATVAVLNKEGKLTASPAPQGPAAGGSATTATLETGGKTVAEMSREERRSALLEAEKRGDISLN